MSVSNYVPSHKHIQERAGSAPRILNPDTSTACSGLSIPQVKTHRFLFNRKKLGLRFGLDAVKDTQNSTLASPITKLTELSHFHTSICNLK